MKADCVCVVSPLSNSQVFSHTFTYIDTPIPSKQTQETINLKQFLSSFFYQFKNMYLSVMYHNKWQFYSASVFPVLKL